MISKKTRIDKWNYYSNIYSVLCKCIACYGSEVNTVCDNDEIGFYFSLIKKKMDKHMNEGLKKYDLTKSQRDVLGYLHFTDKEVVIQKDIEEHFHISNPTVTGILNRLEQKGFIERKHNPKDKRVRAIVLTQKEQDLHEDIENQIRIMESKFSDVLGEEKRKYLLEILKELAQNLE